MASEHTKTFRVRRAARELIIAEADLMGIRLFTDTKLSFDTELGMLRTIEGDVCDFVHSLLHLRNDVLLDRHKEKGFVALPAGESTYYVVKDEKIVRSVKALGARAAYDKLKPKVGERLFLEVGEEEPMSEEKPKERKTKLNNDK